MKYKGILIGAGIGFLFTYFLFLITGSFLSYIEWDIFFIRKMTYLFKDIMVFRIALFTLLIGGFIGWLFQD